MANLPLTFRPRNRQIPDRRVQRGIEEICAGSNI
jgi:hypothetical protein